MNRMRLRVLTAGLLLVVAAAGPVQAHEYHVLGFKIIHPWADATSAGQSEAPVYLRFDEVAVGDRLISARTPFANRVELRAGADPRSAAEVPLKAIEIPAGEPLELAPGGAHLLLRELTAPLQWGRNYAMTLEFERAGRVHVMLSVGAH